MLHGCGRSLVAAVVIALACASPAAAATKTWVGGSAAWSDGASWSPAGVPAATDDVVIDSGTPEVSAADAAAGSIALADTASLTISTGRTLTIGTTKTSTIAGGVFLPHGTLRLNGTTTWSAGDVDIQDAGLVVDAGTLDVTGAVAVRVFDFMGPAGRKGFDVAAGGVTQVSGTLQVQAEMDVDGTLRALAGGTLTQFGSVASPQTSSGVFNAQGTGVLSLSNVIMGAASSATGTGTIAFGNGPSQVVSGAGYAAGITSIGSGGELRFDDDGTTGALRMTGDGLRSGTGTLTVGGGTSQLSQAVFHDTGVTAFGATSQTTIDGTVLLDSPAGGHTLRLDGTTTWSAGDIELQDAGVVQNAGTLDVTGDVAVRIFDFTGVVGRRGFDVLSGGVTLVSGTVQVASEIDDDGTLRALAGGTLTQFGSVASPQTSSGVFNAQGTGVLSLSNVIMGAASSATGTGTITFANGPSQVVSGAGYAAGITSIESGGELRFDDDGTTGALRMTGDGLRSGTGTLTVGGGSSLLSLAVFHDTGVTAFSATSHTTIDSTVLLDSPAGGHTLRLNGTTTWSDGNIELQDAGVVQNAGTLNVTGTVGVYLFDFTGVVGRRGFDVLSGGVTQVSGSLEVQSEMDVDGTLRALAGGTLTQFGTVAAPQTSSGVFNAQGTGVLRLSNVIMGATSSATGTGTIAFANGPSQVVSGAGYAAGVTSIEGGGDLQFDDDGTTGALRMTQFGRRGGTGTLTVGNGSSLLSAAAFRDPGVTVFGAGSHVVVDDSVFFDSPAGGHTLRLNGATTWSAGAFQLQDAGVVENAGTLDITGDVDVELFDSSGVQGPRELRTTGGSLTIASGQTLFAAAPLRLLGGVLGGGGAVNGSVENTGGVVAPGSSPGTLTVTGDYTQGAGGTLRAEIGPQYDRLVVGGAAALDGTLQIVNEAGFEPQFADTFRIVDAGTRSGTFATVSGAQGTPDRRYAPTYDDTGVLLGVGLGPANDVRPAIPASAGIGDTVSCSPGTWTGAPSFAYAWLRNGAKVATGPSYRIAGADGGQAVVCRVTATNANGTGTADSNTLRPAAPPPPTPTPTPSPTPAPTATPPPPPQTGETVNVAAERGTVTVRLPDGRTVPIDQATQIVTGSVIDTRQGAVRLDSRGAHGKLETGVFSEGLFRVTQTTGKRPITELKLVEKLSCPKAKRAQAARKRKRKRRRHLWGDAKGDYRTRGQYGSAVNTGTKWLVEDRCDGTLFRVVRGVIVVTPNGSHKTVRVRAGHRYVVRRPR